MASIGRQTQRSLAEDGAAYDERPRSAGRECDTRPYLVPEAGRTAPEPTWAWVKRRVSGTWMGLLHLADWFDMIRLKSPSSRLLFTTVRLEVSAENGTQSVGTAFYFH